MACEADDSSSRKLIDSICARLRNKCQTDVIRKQLNQILSRNVCQHTDHELEAGRWLSWARGNHNLKVVSAAVPPNIIPGVGHALLHDIKVFTKHGPDDAVYDHNKDIRDKVARGNSFLEISDGPNKGVTCVIYALKKFTGGLGDDDDRDKGDDVTWKRYFLKPIQEAVSLVATEKANGEAAHMACRKFNGQYVICAGSKNVHMVFKNKDDIARYNNEQRYQVAKEVCTAICDMLAEMSCEEKDGILEFLCLTGYTAIFEILNPTHQHVEDLSHLKKPKLMFITWTSSDLNPPPDVALCSVAPHISIQVAEALGFNVVNHTVLPVSELQNRMAKIRQDYGHEGEVLYFLDASGSVIGLLKKKTIWYILCRAIREKARAACTSYEKSNQTFSVSDRVKKVEKRINEIQQWLGLDEDATSQWKDLGEKFVRWCISGLEAGSLTREDVADMFPVTWKRYLSETGATDHIETSWKEPTGSDD